MKRRSEEDHAGLDSFMDIVTNVIGLMVLIAAAIVLNAQEISVSMGAPLLRNPPDGATPIFFDCANGRIVPRQVEVIFEKTDVAVTHYRNQLRYEPNIAQVVQWLNAQDVGNDFYRYTYEFDGNSLTAVLTSKNAEQGETLDELRAGGSDFETFVKTLDRDKNYIYFTVRADSFAILRQARKIAREHGLSTGWRPKHSRYPFSHIVGGGGGWGSEVQ